MVFSLITPLSQTLDGLITNSGKQARDVAFNIQFNNLQNTAIDRMNGEIEKIANVDGNQRELDSLRKTYNKFVADRESIYKFAQTNQANRDRLNELTTLATDTLAAFSLGDSDTDNLSASELAAYQDNLTKITALSDRLVELSHPKFADGNNVTRLRAMVSELQDLTPVEGTIDAEGTDPATNDNFAISDKLRDLVSVSGGASDTSLILEYSANDSIYFIDDKLKSIKREMDNVSVIRAGEIEYKIQIIRSKYATFLRSIELTFDSGSQGITQLSDALSTTRKPDPGSVLSILA